MSLPRRILTIVLSRELFDKLKPFLSRESLDSSTVTSGRGSLVLLRNLTYDLLVIEHPLPDMELDQLLQEIRGAESRCRESQVLVLTRVDPESLEAQLPDPNIAFHSLHEEAERLRALTADRLGIAARRASRMLVEFGVELGAAQILRACQSVNISETGILLRTNHHLPLGTEVELKFSLPNSTRAIRVKGRVVRHTDRDGEGMVGLGVHFDVISRDDRETIAGFIIDSAAEQVAVFGTGST